MLIPVGIDRPLIRRPVVTLLIVAINMIVHLLVAAAPWGEDLRVALAYVTGHGSLTTVLTHQFLHWDVFHLMGNMFFFLVAGLKMEDTLGHWRFLAYYLACGVAANGLHALLASSAPIALVGASGAIAGVLGGFMLMFPRNLVRLLWLIPPFTFRLPAVLFLTLWFGRELWSLADELAGGEATGIAFAAHVGGFATGALLVAGFYGWNRGAALDNVAADESVKVIFLAEEYTAPAATRRPLSDGLAQAWRLRPVAMATALVIVAGVLGQMGAATAQGGLYDARQPQTMAGLVAANEQWIAARQNWRAIGQAARAGDGNPLAVMPVEHMAAMLGETVERHRQLTREGAPAPPGWQVGVARFRQNGVPSLPAAARFKPAEVEVRTALFEPGVFYEWLGASSHSTSVVFDATLQLAVENGWLVTGAEQERDGRRGYVAARREDWVLIAVVVASEVFPGAPVTVLWSLENTAATRVDEE